MDSHKVLKRGYLHHQKNGMVAQVREIVFGLQDGVVSTLGAVSGIAIGSGETFVVLLSGIAIIAVESISMGIGSYTSSRSERKMEERMIREEKEEIAQNPHEERTELVELLVKDGWSKETAEIMAKEAGGNDKLMLQEMAYRELGVAGQGNERPILNGLYMFGAYIIGGSIPLSLYFFLPVDVAIVPSIIVSLIGLFFIGAIVGKYTKERMLVSGGHMLLFGGVALLAGLLVGISAEQLSN